jgi:hypothetical protein
VAIGRAHGALSYSGSLTSDSIAPTCSSDSPIVARNGCQRGSSCRDARKGSVLASLMMQPLPNADAFSSHSKRFAPRRRRVLLLGQEVDP